MKWIAVLGFITALVFAILFFTRKPEVVIEEKPVMIYDTVKVTKPDTVIKYLTKTKTILRIDTINQVQFDTVWVEKVVPIFVSGHTWKEKYFDITVDAFAPCAVDSFKVDMLIDWSGFCEHEYLPKIKFKCRSKNYKFWLGYATGMLVTGGSFYIISQIK